MLSLKRDLLFNLPARPVRPLQASLLQVPVRGHCCSLPYRSASLLTVKANLLPDPVRCQYCSLLDRSVTLWSGKANLPQVPVRYQCCSLQAQPTRLVPISSCKKVLPTSSVAGAAAQQDPEPDFDHQTDPISPVHPMEDEDEVSDQEAGIPEPESDQQLSEEQNYQEMSGLSGHSWAGTKYQNLKVQPLLKMITSFAIPRTQPTGKVSVKLPSDVCCHKMEKLNQTLTEGYPTHSSDTSGLSRDQFIKVPHTQKNPEPTDFDLVLQ